MCSTRSRALLVVVLLIGTFGYARRSFEWTTSSSEAKKLLSEVQARIEDFQFGPETVALARKVVEADPAFAMGEYYVSAVTPAPEAQTHLERAVELSQHATEGERRFIEAMVVVRANNGANFQEGVPLLEALAEEYPEERLVYALLGQIYQASGNRGKARKAFERAQEIGPSSNRISSFLANDDLLEGHYPQARETFQEIERSLPEGSVPFAIRYGTAFSYLYEEDFRAAIGSLEKYLSEYRESGANQNFPEVFIWNSIARIRLEAGHPQKAMDAYQAGYDSVIASSLAEDQKQVWLGRFHHGRSRVLSKMGKHADALAEAGLVRKMIETGADEAEQYLPAYYYLLGYLDLEKGDFEQAAKHLKQSDQSDPFQQLLLARAYEGAGETDQALGLYKAIVASANNGLERALAYPEARQKLQVSTQ